MLRRARAKIILAKFFELTQEVVKSQEEAFQKQLADMVGEKHGYPGCFG